jgi:hypothetical protein
MILTLVLLRRTGGDDSNIGFKMREAGVPPEFKWLKDGYSDKLFGSVIDGGFLIV